MDDAEVSKTEWALDPRKLATGCPNAQHEPRQVSLDEIVRGAAGGFFRLTPFLSGHHDLTMSRTHRSGGTRNGQLTMRIQNGNEPGGEWRFVMQNDVAQQRLSSQEDTSQTLSDSADEARLRVARRAFRLYHAQCFWYLRADLEITHEDLPTIVAGLRKNGGRNGFLLAAALSR